MSYTLEEVAEKTGRSQAGLRKMIERGQLITEKVDGRQMVSETTLDILIGAQVLEEASYAVKRGDFDLVAGILTRLPDRIKANMVTPAPKVIKTAAEAAAAVPFNPVRAVPKPSAAKKRR